MQRDILRVVMSDMHSGSNFALFLNREWQGQKTARIKPRSQQIKIREQFEKFGAEVRRARKDKVIELIHNGDAIDGDHHNSGDVCTTNELEQADIHIELMTEFQKRIGWQRGDRLWYTKGTPVHVKGYEEYIARELNAVPDGDYFAHNLLQLETNGTLSWFVHHGKGRGDGANEGNGVRNWLKNLHYDLQKDGLKSPDIVYTGHVHDPTYSSFIYRQKMNFKTIHGIILPSFQSKTEYAYMVAPVARNKIGGVMQDITKDGIIGVPYFSILDTA